jgi:SAM-dependent methyltransferase
MGVVPKHIQEEFKKGVASDTGVKIDLACGDIKQPGFIGIDIAPSQYVDVVLDLEKTPYPIPSECASMLLASHIVEHIKPWLMIDIMNEWWRLLKVGGQLLIATPYAGSPQFWQDPTHIKGWNEATPEYFDPFAPMSKGGLYHVYRAKPWKIIKNVWDLTGTLEILMEKRPDDPSYHEVKLMKR